MEKRPAHNSAQAQPEKGMRLCAARYEQEPENPTSYLGEIGKI